MTIGGNFRPPKMASGSSLTFFTPAPQPKWDYTNAAAEMIVRLSGFYPALGSGTA